MQVLKHVIGSPSQEDALILHEPSPENFVSLTKSKDQEYIFICSNSKTTSEVGLTVGHPESFLSFAHGS